MADGSVTTRTTPAGSTHGLWIGEKLVLTIQLDKSVNGFPPDLEHGPAISGMIQDLARAAKAVIYRAENDTGDTEFQMQPIEGIADAIILLSQLAGAVNYELRHAEAGEESNHG